MRRCMKSLAYSRLFRHSQQLLERPLLEGLVGAVDDVRSEVMCCVVLNNVADVPDYQLLIVTLFKIRKEAKIRKRGRLMLRQKWSSVLLQTNQQSRWHSSFIPNGLVTSRSKFQGLHELLGDLWFGCGANDVLQKSSLGGCGHLPWGRDRKHVGEGAQIRPKCYWRSRSPWTHHPGSELMRRWMKPVLGLKLLEDEKVLTELKLPWIKNITMLNSESTVSLKVM